MKYQYTVTKGIGRDTYNVYRTNRPYVPPNIVSIIVFTGTIVECAAFMYLINEQLLSDEC